MLYWIINIPERQLEIYTKPSSEKGMYETRQVYSLTDTVSFAIDGQELAKFLVQQLFPRG